MKTGAFKGLLLLLFLIACLTACSDEPNEDSSPVIQPDEPVRLAKDNINFTTPQMPEFVRPEQLPELHIRGIEAHDVRHREWTRGIEVSLKGAGEYFDFENMRARIRGRGNATWGAMGEKRPYRIRFETARSMFGTEYMARDWVLLANSIDYSLMRTVGAFDLGARMGRLKYPVFSPVASQFVHLYIEGDYRGVYQFTDQMQQGAGRIEVEFHEDPALSEYYLHWCRHWQRPDQIFFWADELPFEIRYPHFDDVTEGHIIFAAGFIHELGQAIRGGSFEQVSALIDIPTFVDIYIVNEFTKNADVFFSSMNFALKLEENGKHRLYAGPLWDFDQSAGGTHDGFYPDYSPQGAWAAESNEWFRRLMRIPEWRELVSARWFEIRDAEVAATLAEIRWLTTFYRNDFERNFERWTNKLGQHLWRTPASMRAIDNYPGQVDYLLDWYEQRIIWMDEFLR